MSTPVNDSHKILWFFISGLATIAFATVSGWAIDVNKRIDETAKHQIVIEQTIVRIETKLDILLKFHQIGK